MTDVEEFDLVEHSPQPTPVGQTRPRRSAPWSWAALAAVLVLAGVASAPDRPYPSIGVGMAQGTSAAVLELDLTVPAVPAWSTEIELATPIPVLRPVGDVVIVLDEVVTGYDPATGEPLWRHDAVGETCAVTSQVVCTARDGVGLITSIDPASGETVTLTIPEAEYAIAVDGGLVVAMDVDRGHIMRVDDADERVWETAFDVASFDGDTRGWPDLPVALADDILVVGGPLPYAVDVRNGELMTEPARWAFWSTPFGTTAEGVDALGPVRYLIDRDGDVQTMRADGIALRVDDGIGSDVLLKMDGPLLTATSADDIALWMVPDEAGPSDRIATFAMARLAGVVVAAGVGEVVTVSGHDLVTGEELWRLPEGSWPDTLAGSGSTLLRLENQETLAAMDIRTGDELWQLSTGPVRSVAATDHGLVVLTDGALTSWQWP